MKFNNGSRFPCFLRVHNLIEKVGQVLGVEKYILPKSIYHLPFSQYNSLLHDIFSFLLTKIENQGVMSLQCKMFNFKKRQIKKKCFILINFKYQFKSKCKILKVLIIVHQPNGSVG